MQISPIIYQNFAVKVYSCKPNDLQEEQRTRKIRFHQYLNRQQNTLIEGDVNDIHPCWKAEKEIERKAENFITYLLNNKKKRAEYKISELATVLTKTFNL
jgi:hypothetical protein